MFCSLSALLKSSISASVSVSNLFIATITFNPNTFFYFETEILDYECEKKGYKRLYTPEIKVLHHQNVATNQVYSNLVEKTIFSNKCNFESTSYFLELMGKEK